MLKTYRDGAVGALLDEYERVILELTAVIHSIPDKNLPIIINHQTTDDNCRSVQTILSHVVGSGFGYATSIHNSRGNNTARPVKTFHDTMHAYAQDLANVFLYTENILRPIPDKELEQPDQTLKIKTGWGQLYDIEQMMEHAIVHVLRHRRQIERIQWHELM